MVMRTNSPMDDPIPFQAPEIKAPPKPPRRKKSDWEKLVEHKKFPEISAWIETRKEYFRHFLPDGTPIVRLSKQERMDWWASASQISAEYETLAEMLVEKVGMSRFK